MRLKSRRDRKTLDEQDDDGEHITDNKTQVPQEIENSSTPQTRSDDPSNPSEPHQHENETESTPIRDSPKTQEKDTTISEHNIDEDHEVKSVSLSVPSDFQSASQNDHQLSPKSQQVHPSSATDIHSDSIPVEILFPVNEYGRSPVMDTGHEMEMYAEISSMNQPDHNIDVNQIANKDIDEDVYHMGSVDYDDYRSKYVDGDQSASSYDHGNKDGYKSGSKMKQIVSSMENSSTTLHKIDVQAPKEDSDQPQTQCKQNSNTPSSDNNLLKKSRSSSQSIFKTIQSIIWLSIVLIIS
jgi:hypothetical protein